MAEFCKDCYKQMFGSKIDDEKIVLSSYNDICEGCGAWTHTVDKVRPKSIWDYLGISIKKIK